VTARVEEILARYPARRLRLSTGEEGTGPGGGLGEAVDRVGLQPLAALLGEGEEALLEDGGVSLGLRREGEEAVLRVVWDSGPAFEERVPVGPAAVPAASAPVAAPAAPVPAAAPPPAPTGRLVTDLAAAVCELERPLWICEGRVYQDGPGPGAVQAIVPPVSAERLGAASFRQAHGVRASYVAGAMAGGIASEDLVIAMSRGGMLACFGAGGLDLGRVEDAVHRIMEQVQGGPAGFNLLHNPVEPAVEEATVDLYLRNGVRTVSASAYMRLTPAIVRFRLAGIRSRGDQIIVPQRVLAKVSRPEVAEQFLRPAPDALLRELVGAGILSPEQAALAARIPVAEDVTVEADSGGHTDRRPLVAMLPVVRRLRDRVAAELGYAALGMRPRVGAGGGLGDPASVHAALSMGADYVLTGSVNQASLEAGTSRVAKDMLAEAGIADCTTGPAPDMFELGAQVQVLGRGTMYAQRAQRLYELYRAYGSLEEIPAAERAKVEKTILRRPVDEVWADTAAFWKERDPRQLQQAQAAPHLKMALVFRWYLGMSSRWARTGDVDRRRDYQVWCGPAMGLFNDWVRDTWLEPLEARGVVAIADALLDGAAVLQRAEILRAVGVPLPQAVDNPPPRRRRA